MKIRRQPKVQIRLHPLYLGARCYESLNCQRLDLDDVKEKSTEGPRFMILNLMDDTGDESKHWQMVPVAKSYNVCVYSPPKKYI